MAHLTRAKLIDRLAEKQSHLNHKDAELAVKKILEEMCTMLSNGKRIEIRGFGTFSLRHRPARTGRNPKSGEIVQLPAKSVLYFKPGRKLRSRVNNIHQTSVKETGSVGMQPNSSFSKDE